MDNNEFGLKELTDLTLKATYPIEMAGRIFEPGEVIARFDKIQLANFKEVTSRVSANGGFDNRSHVIWEDPKEIQLSFTQGIFSARQFALLSNAHLIDVSSEEGVLISCHYSGESNEDGKILVDKQDISDVFVYDAKTYGKIVPKSVDFKNGEIVIDSEYRNVEVDFNYRYYNKVTSCILGRKLIQGYLQLEGKSRVKDDITGKTRTAILRIPRLKLVSDLTMRLGREATPVLANFNAIGLPTGERGNKQIMELLFLSDDIDADM